MAVAKKVGARIAVFILGIALGLGTGEIGLRSFKPQRTGPLQMQSDSRFLSIPVPNLHGWEILPGVYTWSFANDSAGRRVTGLVDREKAAARVLLLGDSFTYGVGVNTDQTFAYRLEQRLSQAGHSVAVINAGNPGKGTDYALKFFDLVGRSLKPDVIVLGFYANDFRDNTKDSTLLYRVNADGTLSERTFARPSRMSLRRSIYMRIISWSHLANLARTAVLRYGASRVGGLPVDISGGYVTERNKESTRLFLHGLAKVVRDAGSDLVVFYVPTADEVKFYRETGKVLESEATLRELLTPVGHAPISLLPVLAGSTEPLEKLYFDEQNIGRPSGHWTPMAHALVAGFMEGFVRTPLERRKSQSPE